MKLTGGHLPSSKKQSTGMTLRAVSARGRRCPPIGHGRVLPHRKVSAHRLTSFYCENFIYGGGHFQRRTFGNHSDTGPVAECHVGKSVGERHRETRSQSRVVVCGRVFRNPGGNVTPSNGERGAFQPETALSTTEKCGGG